MKNNLENEYWQQIEKLEWAKDANYNRIEKYLKDSFTVSECIQLNDFVENKTNQLRIRFHDDWLGDPGIDVSDDGWSDLVNEVVGRGKEFYETITVEKLQEMANVMDYHESFSYCFHFTYDIAEKKERWLK